MTAPLQLPLGSHWIPSRQKPGYLLICLPGRGGNKQDFEGIEEEIWHPALGYLYLDAPKPYYEGSSWYNNPNDLTEASEKLTQTLQALEKQGYPPHRCFLLGFSQGGTMVLEFGARHPQLCAGYICMSGRVENLPALLNEANPGIVKSARWLITHGKDDQALSVQTTRDQVTQLKQAGFNIEYHEFNKGHTFDFKSELPLIRRWIRARCAQ